MSLYDLTNENAERGYLVAAEVKQSRPLIRAEDSLDELALLAKTAGITVVGQAVQHLRQIDPSTYIGSGKVQEIYEDVQRLNATIVLFDDELSPRHQRELEAVFGESIKVLDRSALILDIFAQHARTREGALQVELAQYEYRLPRLTRQWTHLARQAGGGGGRGGNAGVGLRGPGETQLEVDRRDISRRISKLKEDLEEVRAHRQRHRAQRVRQGVPVVALVGYTNAGKSTLLNRLTGADVYAANQLFATLDPTTRQLALPGGKNVLLSDTVGFIQKLPTTLIAAFRATLEEVVAADVIIHVVDASHPMMREQIETVEDTLAQIETPNLPLILVLNKIDALEGQPTPDLSGFGGTDRYSRYAAVVPLSARTGTGTEGLLTEIAQVLQEALIAVHVTLPYQRGDLVALIHDQGVVNEESHTETGVVIDAHVPPRLAAILAEVKITA
ncbi:MAG TPA: GTPase HflX [Aggregatilineales bacterium]|nr:GTPase HflX [Anaerolineales bacterium]HRE48162.1 GTPase HflX [Aggregatilineales bacterium]